MSERRKGAPNNGTAPKSAAARMAAMRDRKRKTGMKPIELWAHPDDHQAIRDEAARLDKARREAMGERRDDD